MKLIQPLNNPWCVQSGNDAQETRWSSPYRPPEWNRERERQVKRKAEKEKPNVGALGRCRCVCEGESKRASGRERDCVFQTLPKSITIGSLG